MFFVIQHIQTENLLRKDGWMDKLAHCILPSYKAWKRMIIIICYLCR